MSISDHIRIIGRQVLDLEKWNRCVDLAHNGLIYGYSYYLDQMASQWEGLVLNDYEAVMPLTWRKKYGIRYLYQPAFTPSTGVFGNQLSEEMIQAFIDAIPMHYRWIGIAMNYNNALTVPSTDLRRNYTLSLLPDYPLLQQNYRDHILRNVKKAEAAGCQFKKDIPLAEVIALSRKQMQPLTNVGHRDYKHFEQLFRLLNPRQQASTFGVYSSQGQLLASCVFFLSHQRVYYILVGNHAEGKSLGASPFLIDRFIREQAGTKLLLDFEGSDIASLAFFYESFGAASQTYPFVHINRLPSFLRWFKK